MERRAGFWIRFAATLLDGVVALRSGRRERRASSCSGYALPGWWRWSLRWQTKYFGIIYMMFFLASGRAGFYWVGGLFNAALRFLFALNEDRLTWLDEWAGTAVCCKRQKAARAIAPPPLPAT